jgi:hypothetical protein
MTTASPPGSDRDARTGAPWWRAGRFMDRRRTLARTVALGLMTLALAVQVFVWGTAPRSGSGGALVPGLRAELGTPYAVVLLAIEVGLCLYFGLRDVAVMVLTAGALVDVVFWAAHLDGLRFAFGGAAAMTAAFGSVALGAGVWRRPRAGRHG